jgi:hypothetical protein
MLHFLSDSEAGSSRATGIRCGPVAETEALSRLAVGCGPQKLYNAPIQGRAFGEGSPSAVRANERKSKIDAAAQSLRFFGGFLTVPLAQPVHFPFFFPSI